MVSWNGATEGDYSPYTPVNGMSRAQLNALIRNGISASNYAKTRKNFASVRNNTANFKLLCMGDSTTMGVGGSSAPSSPQVSAYPAKLAALLNSYHIPAEHGLMVPQSFYSTDADNRWNLGTGWAKQNFGWGSGSDYRGLTTAGNLVVTPGILADTYDIYVIQNPTGLGTIGVTATGGAQATFNTNVGPAGISKFTCTASAANINNTLTIVNIGGGDVHICGIEPRLSTQAKVLVGNAGVGGSKTGDWSNASTNIGGIAAIKGFAPDLTVISLGINDAINASTPTSVYKTNMQAIIDAAKLSGDVLLVSPFPSNTGSYEPTELTYLPILTELSVTNGVGFINLHDRFISGSRANSDGYMSDTLHPNNAGYADMAQVVFNTITRL
jgi:lysophospholipase L1-like esterase